MVMIKLIQKPLQALSHLAPWNAKPYSTGADIRSVKTLFFVKFRARLSWFLNFFPKKCLAKTNHFCHNPRLNFPLPRPKGAGFKFTANY
jgi:hypothetical protein